MSISKKRKKSRERKKEVKFASSIASKIPEVVIYKIFGNIIISFYNSGPMRRSWSGVTPEEFFLFFIFYIPQLTFLKQEGRKEEI